MSGARNTSFISNTYADTFQHLKKRGLGAFWRGAGINAGRLFLLSYLQLALYDLAEDALPF